MGRAARHVPHARPARVPVASSARSPWKGTLLALRRGLRRAGRWRPRSRPSARLQLREKALLGWAGLRGAVPVVLATFPVIDGVPRSRRVLQHRLLRRAALDRPAGHDDRARRALAGGDVRRAGPDAPRCSRSARCASSARDVVEHVVRAGGRRGGRAAARPRAAARRARLADHARRRGAAAARLDAAGGGRPPARARAPRGRAASCPRCSSAGATGPVARPVRPPRTYTGSVPVYTARPWGAADGDPGAPARVGGNEVVEHLRTRRDVPGALVVLGGRALRGHRADPHDRAARPAAGPGAPAAASRGHATTPRSPGGRRSSAPARCEALPGAPQGARRRSCC